MTGENSDLRCGLNFLGDDNALISTPAASSFRAQFATGFIVAGYEINDT
jgi:hypothetical protein